MKTFSILQQLCAASLYTNAAFSSLIAPREPAFEDVYTSNLDFGRRSTPQAPNGYTPASVDCPSTRPSIRAASQLSDQEKSWLEKRRNNTITPMRELLVRLNITGFDAGSYIDNNKNNASALPNIGLAFSGGGYRAMTNGAGAVAAYDSRTPNSTNKGQVGGLLQSATYIAGLSGGGWLVGSLYSNNFTSVQSIIDTDPDASGSLWQLGNSILKGPEKGKIQLLSTAEYYHELVDAVSGKVNAGFDFNSSLTDYWGRALSYQLVNASEGGPAYTFSSIADDADFSNANAPMPILVADGRAPGDRIISLNTTVYEFNPWEMGSWDPTLYGFAPMKYVGSNFTGGELADDQKCIAGFDNVGFVMGTSSSLFNQIAFNLDSLGSLPDFLKNAIQNLLNGLDSADDDIADWTPNPFYQFHNDSNPSAGAKRLTLVDGGEDLQNIPLVPLIQPNRHVDVIFAVDSSADTVAPSAAAWPNGTAMVASYARSLNQSMANGTAFPSIPDQNTFVNLGLNTRPTFFGCNASNITGEAPLIVYLPNHPYVYNSNVSTYQLAWNNTERNTVIENGYDVVTMANGTVDSQWPTCVGCAILSRSLDRTKTQVPDVCSQCFQKYCWDGTVNSSTPAPYFPSSVLKQISVKSGVERFVPNFVSLGAAAVVSLLLIL